MKTRFIHTALIAAVPADGFLTTTVKAWIAMRGGVSAFIRGNHSGPRLGLTATAGDYEMNKKVENEKNLERAEPVRIRDYEIPVTAKMTAGNGFSKGE